MYQYSDLIVRLAMESFEVLVFIYYLTTATKFLRRSADSQSLSKDPYTFVMILLLCETFIFRMVASLPFCLYYLISKIPSEDPNVPYYLQSDYDQSWFRYVAEFLDYSTLRIAVLVNLTRWILLHISLRKVDLSIKLRRSRNANYCMGLLVSI